jgi:hypothetical protein
MKQSRRALKFKLIDDRATHRPSELAAATIHLRLFMLICATNRSLQQQAALHKCANSGNRVQLQRCLGYLNINEKCFLLTF